MAAVRSQRGSKYADARKQLLAHPDAQSYLQTASSDQALDDETRWLAEILLWRAQQPQEVDRLEQILHDKIAANFNSGNVSGDLIFPEVMLTREELPVEAVVSSFCEGRFIHKGDDPKDDPFGEFKEGDPPPRFYPTLEECLAGKVDPDVARAIQSYLRMKLLPPSDKWGLVAGETLLKGWTRTPPLPRKLEYREEWAPGDGGFGFGGRGPTSNITAMAHRYYISNALHMLGALRELRREVPSSVCSKTLSERAWPKWPQPKPWAP